MRKQPATRRLGVLALALTSSFALLSCEPNLRRQKDSRPRQQTTETVCDLLQLPKDSGSLEAWMQQAQWLSKRHRPRHFRVTDSELRMVSDGDSVMLATDTGLPLDPQLFRKLRFELRVNQTPTGTDLSKKAGDDAAFRLYVAFDRGGGLLSQPNTIGYTWAARGKPGTWGVSPHYSSVHWLIVGVGKTEESAAATRSEATWVTIERDLIADYHRAFPKDKSVPVIKAIILKCDTNNTKTRAEAWIRCLQLVSPKRS